MLLKTPQDDVPLTVDPYNEQEHDIEGRLWKNSSIACRGAVELFVPEFEELPEIEGLFKLEPWYLWEQGEDFETMRQINGTCWSDDGCWYNTCDRCEEVNDLAYDSAKYCISCHLLLCERCHEDSDCDKNGHEIIHFPDDLGIGPLMNWVSIYDNTVGSMRMFVNGDINSPYYEQVLLQTFDDHARFGLYRIPIKWKDAVEELKMLSRGEEPEDYGDDKVFDTLHSRNNDGRATTHCSYALDDSPMGCLAAAHGVFIRNYG